MDGRLQRQAMAGMMTALPDGLAAVIEEDHSALNDFMRGNPEPKKRIYSRGDDATLANLLGPPARGCAAVSRRLNEASATLRDATSLSFERVSAVVTADLAYTVEIEHYPGQQFAGSDERHDFELRVRRSSEENPLAGASSTRHADGITTTRPVESVLQR